MDTPTSELTGLIRELEVIIINFGLSDGPKLDDAPTRMTMIRVLEFLSSLRK